MAVKGVLLRFAKRGDTKIYLTEYNHDFILWRVVKGAIVDQFNYYREHEEAETGFERLRNDLALPEHW